MGERPAKVCNHDASFFEERAPTRSSPDRFVKFQIVVRILYTMAGRKWSVVFG